MPCFGAAAGDRAATHSTTLQVLRGGQSDAERSTRVVQKEQDPTWNETLVWYLDAKPLTSDSFVTVQLQDWSIKAENRNYGFANIALASAAEKPKVMITVKDQVLRDDELKPTGDSAMEEAAPKEEEAPEVPTSTANKKLSNKKQPFQHPGLGLLSLFLQVRVGIIECRQLQENNIKPVVKVMVGDRAFRTRIKLGNNPYYNETFVQNFNETPQQLFDQFITIQVLNSRAIRADSIIGVFRKLKNINQKHQTYWVSPL
ncbi:Fer-1-like protein 5 [Varanus komodoensis]|nr:Fer-1-like protein 5 [Varanus komodoensis]